MNAVFISTQIVEEGEKMDPQTQTQEPNEAQLQARDCEAPADASLPAEQTLTEQSQDADVYNTAPRFIP